MFSRITLLLSIGLVYAQGPQLCTKITEYSACSSKAANQIAGCNRLVTDTPTFAYYDCVCNGYTASLNCYSICPDDPQMQMQRQSQEVTRFGTCQYVDEQKKLGKNLSSISAKATKTAVKIGSSTVDMLIPATNGVDADGKPLPPMPSPPPSMTGPVTFDNDATVMSTGVALMLSFFAPLLAL